MKRHPVGNWRPSDSSGSPNSSSGGSRHGAMLGETISDTVLKLGDYLEDQTAKGVLRVENPRLAARQFMAMLFEPLMMELTIGVRGPVSEKEISEIVDASVSTFLRAFRA